MNMTVNEAAPVAPTPGVLAEYAASALHALALNLAGEETAADARDATEILAMTRLAALEIARVVEHLAGALVHRYAEDVVASPPGTFAALAELHRTADGAIAAATDLADRLAAATDQAAAVGKAV